MKTIFKTILIAITLLPTASIIAQSPFQLGVKAGLNLSNLGVDIEEFKAKFGFTGGVTADYNFTRDLYLMTGVEFVMKGAKFDKEREETKTLNISYLQMPVHIGYKLRVDEGTKLVFRGGPYGAYGLKAKSGGTDFFKESAIKRFDVGIGLGLGAEFGKFDVGIGYDLGLLNIAYKQRLIEMAAIRNLSTDGIVRNQNIYLAIGHKF